MSFKKKLNFIFNSFLAVVVFTSMFFTCFTYGSEPLTRTHIYVSNQSDYEYREFDKEIKNKGNEYVLTNIEYKILESKTITKKVKDNIVVKSKKIPEGEVYIPKKTIVQNNITYRLKNTTQKNITTTVDIKRKVTGYLDFESKEDAQNSNKTQYFTVTGTDGNKVSAYCNKKNIEKLPAASWQDSYITLDFTSDSPDYYEWQGKEVNGKANNPLKGREAELLKSIGANTKEYRVKNIFWMGKAVKKRGIYYRTLKANIQKKIPHYRVNYVGYSTGRKVTATIYTSKYVGKREVDTGKRKYKIKATAFYSIVIKEPEILKKPIVKLGIFIFAFIIVGILFIIYFKSDKKDKKETHKSDIKRS